MLYRDRSQKYFWKNESGNAATVFVALSLPILAAVGGAIDYGSAVSTRTKLQNALDTAAAAVCADASRSADETIRARLGSSLQEFGMDLLPAPPEGTAPPEPTGSQAIVVDTGFDAVTGVLSPSIETHMPTSILGMVGMNELPILVSSSLRCTGKDLELSVMLDLSGSMGDTVNGEVKIDSMKQAAQDVVDIFRINLENGTTRIALVPFSKGVKLGSFAEAARGPISPGASSTPGSAQLNFYDEEDDDDESDITDCVSERIGAQSYTDAPASAAYVGYVYRPDGNCMPTSATLLPLTSNVTALEAAISGYITDGNTAGQIGTAWSWYTLSDKWASFWPTGSQPAVPNAEELTKATILMTDGRYNTQYCNGVDDGEINCAGTNGDALAQAAALCEAMKDPNGDGDLSDGVVVYTVGFDISSGSEEETMLKNCASDANKWFFPYDGAELRTSFQTIGKTLAAGQFGYPIFTQ